MVAGFAARTAGRARRDRRLMIFWGLSALALLGLGLNKQLDLQIDLMRLGRASVVALGLYPGHRAELMFAVGGLALLGLGLSVGLLMWLVRGRWARTWLAALGWVVIAAFIALRAASFHHLEELGLSFVNWVGVLVLEVGGLGLLVVASVRGGHASPRR